ncbi:MAG: hypothetical protein ACK5GN_03590 [Pseudomonadota bacterium]
MSVKLAKHLPCVSIGCWFDSRPRIDSVLVKPVYLCGPFGKRKN